MVGVRQLFLAIAMRKSAVVEYIYDCYPVTWAATLLLAVYYLTVRKRLLPEGKAILKNAMKERSSGVS